MATWYVALFSKWTTVGGRNEMQCALDFPAEWTDFTGQPDDQIKNRSIAYCFMALGRVSDAVLASIQANPHYQILARWEDADVPSFDNRQSTVTLAQKNAFVTYFNTEYGIDVSKIPVIANSVGRTRQAVLRDIVQDMRSLR